MKLALFNYICLSGTCEFNINLVHVKNLFRRLCSWPSQSRPVLLMCKHIIQMTNGGDREFDLDVAIISFYIHNHIISSQLLKPIMKAK